MKSDTDKFYSDPNSYLAQGDIFHLDMVGPFADEVKRIFRTTDGRHGSVFFEGECSAKVFSQGDLEMLLATTSRTELHTDPFSKTEDGQAEMVVVPAELFRYFIVASNTCDISGQDAPPKLATAILPVITLADMCKSTKLELKTSTSQTTIHTFIMEYYPQADGLESCSDVDYGEQVRLNINRWIDSKPTKKLLEDARRIKNFLQRYFDGGYLFSLPQNIKYSLPESYVDFTAVLTVPTEKLFALKNHRFVRIADRYCDSFARKFGDFFSRLALPERMRPN